jgi:hypothetical protein
MPGGFLHVVKVVTRPAIKPLERALGHGKGHGNSGDAVPAPVPTAPVPPAPVLVPERVTQLEQQVTLLEQKVVNESARANGVAQELGVAKQELKDTKEVLETKEKYAERSESLKAVGEKMARAMVSRHLDKCRYHAAAELVRNFVLTDTETMDFSTLDGTESKAVIRAALIYSDKIERKVRKAGYARAAANLRDGIMWCHEKKRDLETKLITSGELCFPQLEMEEKFLADQSEPQTGEQLPVEQLVQLFPHLALREENFLAEQLVPPIQEQPLIERFVETVAQFALVDQPEPMTTDGQSSSEYLEAQEPNPALLFASGQMPLSAFIAQPEIQENAPVQGDALVQDDALAVRIRVAG